MEETKKETTEEAEASELRCARNRNASSYLENKLLIDLHMRYI